ncbi:hypothetical protein KIL84_009666 [Mauremys mutica]|uniref:Uncharacterized protein n=1 Tax=Mauremys mutica TaxID=74926 RepID=A0A9D3XL37_9SAUR|nr:hypothetical protein KIL84_009666 [Mauremys mutica]
MYPKFRAGFTPTFIAKFAGNCTLTSEPTLPPNFTVGSPQIYSRHQCIKLAKLSQIPSWVHPKTDSKIHPKISQQGFPRISNTDPQVYSNLTPQQSPQSDTKIHSKILSQINSLFTPKPQQFQPL